MGCLTLEVKGAARCSIAQRPAEAEGRSDFERNVRDQAHRFGHLYFVDKASVILFTESAASGAMPLALL